MALLLAVTSSCQGAEAGQAWPSGASSGASAFVPSVNTPFQSSCSPVERNQDDPDNRQADADDKQEPRIGGGPLGVDEECHHRRHEADDGQEPGEGLLHVRPQCTGSAARVANPTAARRSWPRGSSTRYSITWSARLSSDCGIVSPRVFAVLRLMINSNFVGCSTGSSLGFAPLRILSTYVAARRARSFRSVA